MRIAATSIAGLFTLEIEPHRDERGFFARAFCEAELAAVGVTFTSPQINISRNTERATLRGMHFQPAPCAEAKLVRVMRGAILDVVADIRRDSPTYTQWLAFELDADKANALLIPEGLAHGFLTLTAETDVLYQMGRAYVPGKAAGFRYDDPAFAISWPEAPRVIGTADLAWAPWTDAAAQ